MKLIRVQYMHDGSKAIFFFSADGRIDFRDLVKDLAGRFRTRIEMRQIGVRDGAKMVGGIGSCGRELCCSTFLSSFAPVSIRMAKDQGLTLNPKKVSGMCGRLMCCLVYEQHVYRRAKKRLPRVGRAVMTAMGPGSIRNVDIVAERVRVRLDDGPEEEFAANDVVLLDGRGRKRGPRRDRPRQPEAEQASGPVNPDDQLKQALKEAVDGDETYLWDDGDNKAGQSEREAKPKRSGRRRRGRRRGRGDKRTASSEGGRAQKDGKSSGGQRKGQSQKEGGRTGRSRGKGSARADGTRASTTEDKPQGNKRRRRRRRRSGGNRSGGGEGGKGKDG